MTNEIFEYRNQARGPRGYLALAVIMAVLYAGWSQGWGLVGVLLCGPALGWILSRLIQNDAQGFRMTAGGLDYHNGPLEGEVGWPDLAGVTITGDGAGGCQCHLHLHRGRTVLMPATQAFSPDRLTQEFRKRGVPVWRPAASVTGAALAA
jgi:hypothetical protein